jgi:DNA-binding NarL/FixJ family response regulator
MCVAPPVTIMQSQRETLQQWARSRSLHGQFGRANVVLLAAEGKADLEIAAALNISPRTLRVGGSGFCSSIKTGW